MLVAPSEDVRHHTPAVTTAAATDRCVRQTLRGRPSAQLHVGKHACRSPLQSTHSQLRVA